ncbi:hypothetical protein [Escherichia coli]|uniref:Glycosyltransferase n=4 Tax=Escherichia coli TaxID=562 RepID=A0A0A8J6C1_ECOLX|nr:hypothetical protein [Escherichia coli]EFN8614357.1 hypothetical protein [Escherichia coli O41:H45]AUY77095.1 hypothetical protein BWI83_17605 [Escherichia coli]EET2948941.1 hypothetical protein [Escherichia coli]EET7792204.1 hypothetical protein [Escherichia coli]EEZ4358433.1 hypothetical protein [Escherichia coli]
MNYNVELFIGVCVTYDDFNKYKLQLLSSLKNLYNSFAGDCSVYIVIQSERCSFDYRYSYPTDWIEFYETDYFGISNARNLCIEACLRKNAKFIIFHDASIYWTKSAAEFIHRFRNNIETPRINLLFDKNYHMQHEFNHPLDIQNIRIEKCNPIYNSYVGGFLFRVSKIKELRFHLGFGPGKYTKCKSGEDVLFLFEYFERQNITLYPINRKIAVIHPPRPSDYSKHLLYAYGQGALFRFLVHKYKRMSLFYDLILFFGNALVRCLLFKKKSFQILYNRLKGFIGV